MKNRAGQWMSGLSRTRKSAFGKIATLLGTSEIKAGFWDDLEALLIQADLGINSTIKIVDELREQAKNNGWTKTEEIRNALRIALRERLNEPVIFDQNI